MDKMINRIFFKTEDFSSETLLQLLTFFENDNMLKLEEEGYVSKILYFAFLFSYFKQKTYSFENLLFEYYDINRKRIDDQQFFELINSCNIEKFKSKLIYTLSVRKSKSLSCMMCHTHCSNILYLPCGHIVTCEGCKNAHQCNDCGASIKERHRVYF